MGQTTLNKYITPNEDEEPFFDTFNSMISQFDVGLWNNKIRSNFILAGGGNPTFDSGTEIISWTSDWVLKNPISGTLIRYRFGPDGENRAASIFNGQLIFASFPSRASSDEIRNLQVANKIDISDTLVVIGFRFEDKVYMSNGVIL